MSDFQETQSDVQPSEGSVGTPDSASSAPSQQPAEQQEASSQGEKPTPFHEHPRFKELIEQKRAQEEQISNYSRQMQEMQRTLREMQTASSKKEDPLLARLKSIDPEFGSRFEKLSSLEGEIQQFREFQQQMQLQAYQQQASSNLQNLYEQHKVPENLRGRYEREIKAIAYENPDLRVEDLPKVFEYIHREYSGFLDGLKRQERESYLKDKQSGQTPQSVSGGTAAASGKQDAASMTRDQAVNEIVRQMKAAKQKI